MKEHFLTYEQSLAVKELGFDEHCFGSWENKYSENPTYAHSISLFYKNSNHPIGNVTTPLKSQFFKWVREKYKISFVITCHSEQGNSWAYHIPNDGGERNFETYEQAEYACINNIIELIKL